jgi:hypothetical protein
MGITLEDNLLKYKVKSIHVKIPEFVYEKLMKYKLVYNLDAIVVNHLIDKIQEIENRRNNKIQDDLLNDGLDDESIPELEGMLDKKKKH